MTEPTRELDTVIAELVAAATTGGGVDAHHLAQELGAAGITSPETLRIMEQLMTRLVDADQRGKPVDAMELARQLGPIRAALTGQENGGPAVARGQVRFRCEQCGTVLIEMQPPSACPKCGGTKFARPDLDQPNVESGAG
ncbi:MAG: hypothetical protein NVS9B6_17220 [Candidatus Limnocylindrales bacterium]